MKKLFLIVVYVFVSLVASSHASATNDFPYQAVDLNWSRILSEEYTNGCVDDDGQYNWKKCGIDHSGPDGWTVVITDSKAAQACLKIGGRLPTENEYKNLIRTFDHYNSNKNLKYPVLTKKGRVDWSKILGEEDLSMGAWTASTGNMDFATYFNGYDANWTASRYYTVGVRCVKPLAPSN